MILNIFQVLIIFSLNKNEPCYPKVMKFIKDHKITEFKVSGKLPCAIYLKKSINLVKTKES